MGSRSKPGSFTAYLEYAQRSQSSFSSEASPVALLRVLAATAQQELPANLLLKICGMDATQFVEALKALEQAGFVSVQRSQADEVVRLTPAGARLAATLHD